jgi:hypothetical protein
MMMLRDIPRAVTSTATEKLLMLRSRAVCRLVHDHFILRQSGAGEIDHAALADLSDKLGRIAHDEARKAML